MNTFELMYLPSSTDNAAVSSAIGRLLADSGKDRFHYRHFASVGRGSIDIQSLPPKNPQRAFGLQITVSPAALVHGPGAFTSFGGAALVKPLLAEVSRAVQGCLGIDSDGVSVEIEQLTIMRAIMECCFLLDSQLDATSALMDFAQHAKIVRDFAGVMPSRTWKVPKRQPPRVSWSSELKHVIQVDLPFGEARAFLADVGRTPAQFAGGQENIEAAKALARSILCVEITANIGSVSDPMDRTATLPVKLDRWTHEAMRINPYAFIWNAFAWECWLNEDFSNADTDFSAIELADEPRELLEIYLRGESYRDNTVVRNDYKRLLEFRRALILKAGVDLLNPWRSFRLNKAQAMRPLLAFDKRLKTENHQVLNALTLSPADALKHGLALNAAARLKPVRGTWL